MTENDSNSPICVRPVIYPAAARLPAADLEEVCQICCDRFVQAGRPQTWQAHRALLGGVTEVFALALWVPERKSLGVTLFLREDVPACENEAIRLVLATYVHNFDACVNRN
jgi:hypothetical protein